MNGRYRSLFMSLHLQQTLPIGQTMVYDQFYPSLQKRSSKTGKTVLERRICPHCNLYHSTMKMMDSHRVTCEQNPRVIKAKAPKITVTKKKAAKKAPKRK
jgi:hypothetical protein